MSKVNRLPPPSANQETATNVLKFIGNAMIRPFAPFVAEVDRLRAAHVIQLPVGRGMARAAADQPPVQVVSKVKECIKRLFPTLQGAVQEQMIATLSRKVSEDPRASQLFV